MPITTYLNLEKLILKHSKARLRGTVTAQLTLSGLEDVLNGAIGPDRSSLERIWVQRGQNTYLELCISVDGEPLEHGDAKELGDALLQAKMWSQLGLRAVPIAATGTITNPQSANNISISLQYNIQNAEESASSIYDICYRIPPPDIVPPCRIDTASLDTIRLTLTINRQKEKRPSTKRRKTNVQALEEGSEDELLMTLPEEDLTEIAAIIAMVDAGVRMNISGEFGRRNKGQARADGLKARFLDTPRPLSSIAPALFNRGYLKAMSMRAALLPTVVHALSHSLNTRCRSPTLKTKLEKFFSCGPHHVGGGASDGLRVNYQDVPPAARFDIISAGLWTLMQKQLLKDRPTPKLHLLTARMTNTEDGEDEEDEDLFASQAPGEPCFDSRFYEDEMLGDAWIDDDSDLLFDDEDWYDDDVEGKYRFDLDDGQGTSRPGLFSDTVMLDEDDGDLLLDLMLDEGRSDE